MPKPGPNPTSPRHGLAHLLAGLLAAVAMLLAEAAWHGKAAGAGVALAGVALGGLASLAPCLLLAAVAWFGALVPHWARSRRLARMADRMSAPPRGWFSGLLVAAAPWLCLAAGRAAAPLWGDHYDLPGVVGLVSGAALALPVSLLAALLLGGRWLAGASAFGACATVLLLTGPSLYDQNHWLVLLPLLPGWFALQPWLAGLGGRLQLLVLLPAALALPAAGLYVRSEPALAFAAMERLSAVRGLAGWSRLVLDLDRDGESPFMGRNECDDLDPGVARGAVEIVGNGKDDNCAGGDLAAPPAGLDLPLLPRRVELARRPNIFIISVDALRADHVGLKVKGRSITPNIDTLLARSVYFERAYAPAPYTSASLAATWTSSPPLSMVTRGRWHGFEASVIELLTLAGYWTQAILNLPTEWYSALGFMEVDVQVGADNPEAPFQQQYSSAATTAKALHHAARLKGRGRPILMWVHYLDPHLPYLRHRGYAHLGGGLRHRYAQEVMYVDEHVGRLIAGLRELGLTRGSVVILLSDHGESLGERGQYSHGWSLNEEAIRVPLAIYSRGLSPGRVKTPVSLMDLAPTLMEMLGGPRPPLWRGRSLLPAMRGQELAPKPVYVAGDFWGLRGPSFAVVDWPWKYQEAAPFGLSRLDYLGGGEAPAGEAPAVERRLRRLLGQHLDMSLNSQWLRRKATLLRHPRPGCAWVLKVGKDPAANRSLEQGFVAGNTPGCGIK